MLPQEEAATSVEKMGILPGNAPMLKAAAVVVAAALAGALAMGKAKEALPGQEVSTKLLFSWGFHGILFAVVLERLELNKLVIDEMVK